MCIMAMLLNMCVAALSVNSMAEPGYSHLALVYQCNAPESLQIGKVYKYCLMGGRPFTHALY